MHGQRLSTLQHTKQIGLLLFADSQTIRREDRPLPTLLDTAATEYRVWIAWEVGHVETRTVADPYEASAYVRSMPLLESGIAVGLERCIDGEWSEWYAYDGDDLVKFYELN